jgi:DNA-binding Xre family transcriptional regulator
MELVEKVGLNSRTASKVWKDEPVSWDTVDKICNYYGLRIDQVIEHVPD